MAVEKRKAKKSLGRLYDKGFEAGVRMALSIAVNHFNCPENVREGVFKYIEIENNENNHENNNNR